MVKQLKFLKNGTGVILTKAVGLRFNEASKTLEVGEPVTVREIHVDGFENVLGVFNKNGKIGNILANKTFEEREFELRGGKVFTNVDLINDYENLKFRVKSFNKFSAVLTASF